MKQKIKIGVWILSEYKPQTGGGFSLYDKIIRMIDEHKFPDDIEICFVGHKSASNYKFSKKYISLSTSAFVAKFSHKSKMIGKREGKILHKNGVDVIYYSVQGFRKVNSFPFVSANWDIGHKSTFAFPEFASNDRFEFREKWYSKEIFKALMVFAESESGKKELIDYTGLNPDRVGIVPLMSGAITELSVSDSTMNEYLASHKLTQWKFFFYPAQFWAHKNHYNLLLAFRDLVAEYSELKLVLTGSDKGNKNYIMNSVKELNIESNVLFTGFINNECLYSFYKNALAMIYPGLLGPTNMPILEAAMLRCPVLCSDLDGHKEIMKNGALYFNGLDAASIYENMKLIIKDSKRSELLYKADNVMQTTVFKSEFVIKSLIENFRKLKSIRNCWGESDKIF
jgi:glycosyltransferase involved in cell wall biosynthesis